MKTSLETILENITGPVALAFSYQAEDAAVLHLLLQSEKLRKRLSVFTLDTLKLFPETIAYHEQAESFFGILIQRYSAAEADIRNLEKELGGELGMRDSLEKRQLCCKVRKVFPLREALHHKSAWITGMRAAQSVTRAGLPVLEWDRENNLIKINPIADWTDGDLDGYIKQHGIPLHPLYDQGFKSIGCAPCTRAVQPGEDIRAGRWWWEKSECKECGLHRQAMMQAESSGLRKL